MLHGAHPLVLWGQQFHGDQQCHWNPNRHTNTHHVGLAKKWSDLPYLNRASSMSHTLAQLGSHQGLAKSLRHHELFLVLMRQWLLAADLGKQNRRQPVKRKIGVVLYPWSQPFTILRSLWRVYGHGRFLLHIWICLASSFWPKMKFFFHRIEQTVRVHLHHIKTLRKQQSFLVTLRCQRVSVKKISSCKMLTEEGAKSKTGKQRVGYDSQWSRMLFFSEFSVCENMPWQLWMEKSEKCLMRAWYDVQKNLQGQMLSGKEKVG